MSGSAPARLRRLAVPALAAVFAGLVLGLGFWVGRVSAAAPTGPEGPRYLLLLREAADDRPPPEVLATQVAEYTAWARELAARGHLVAAEKLRADARWLRAVDGEVTVARDRTPETPRHIGGFFLITAASRADAERLARGSPHLRYGGTIEFRVVDAR